MGATRASADGLSSRIETIVKRLHLQELSERLDD